MVRTSAPGSSSGQYVDYNAGTSTPGTQLIAADRNMTQEEIANVVEGAGLTLSGASDEQLKQAIIALSHSVGELLFNARKLAPSITFPAVRIDDAAVTLAAANYPDLVTALRAEAASSAGVSSFACTIAGSVVTFPATTAADELLAALYDDAQVQGGDGETASYTNWLCLNVAGTDYAIAAVAPGSRTVTVAGSPATGSQTVILYPYRIAGSATSARIQAQASRALLAQNGGNAASGYTLIAGLRRRDRGQGHFHVPLAPQSNFFGNGGAGLISASVNAILQTSSTTGGPSGDGANGTPRAGPNTEPRGLASYLYMWAGRYVA